MTNAGSGRTLARACLLSGALAAVGTLAAALQAPAPGSPGTLQTAVHIERSCPTFSWAEVAGARGYEIVVYRVDRGVEAEDPVLRTAVPAPSASWTPARGECLERGARYAWTVRALAGDGESAWPEPYIFEVSRRPSAAEIEGALDALRRALYIEKEAVELVRPLSGSPESADRVPAASPAAARSTTSTRMLEIEGGIEVNGSAVMTQATLGKALCRATEVRFLDQGDGTVLDCDSGLVWLKDASCADLLGTPGGYTSWRGALAAAGSLSSGSCGLTDGSSPGDWRVPTISEFCSSWRGATEICSAVTGSLIDSTVGPPAVANARQDGIWTENDAFVDVRTSTYWSSTQFDDDYIWTVGFADGWTGITPSDGQWWVWPVRDSQ